MKKINIEQFRSDGEIFLQELLNELIDMGVPVQELKVDHLCYRVETSEDYEKFKSFLSEEGTILTESLVNGRFISTFFMEQLFKVGDQIVNLVELPAPKANTYYKEGFEHAEFIIQESFDRFAARFPLISFSKGGNKNINPEFSMQTKIGQAKFHYQSLDRVIEIEQAVITDIIFDFDGTIVNSRESIIEINRLVFSQVLEKEISIEYAKENFHPEFSKLFEAYGVVCPNDQQKAITLWSSLSGDFSYKLFDGFPQLLKELSQSKFRLHLWTARDEVSARNILAEHKLESLFTTMSFATSINSKPHSDSVKFNWKEAQKNTMVLIGDSPTDMIGSKNIGAISAAALWEPYVQDFALINSGAELFFYKVDELREWLGVKSI